MRLFVSLRRCRSMILLGLLFSQLLACGSFHVAGAILSSNVTTTSGTVSVVRLTVVSNANGTFVNVTAVTLLVPMGSDSLMLCGDHASSFTMNSNVQVSFTQGQDCSNLVMVKQV